MTIWGGKVTILFIFIDESLYMLLVQHYPFCNSTDGGAAVHTCIVKREVLRGIEHNQAGVLRIILGEDAYKRYAMFSAAFIQTQGACLAHDYDLIALRFVVNYITHPLEHGSRTEVVVPYTIVQALYHAAFCDVPIHSEPAL